MSDLKLLKKVYSTIYIVLFCVFSYISYLVIDGYVLYYLSSNGVNVNITGTEISGNPVTLLQSKISNTPLYSNIFYIAKLVARETKAAILLLIDSYDLIIITVSCFGLICAKPLVRCRIIVIEMLALVASALYHTPWTSMTGYPLVYITAAYGCDRISRVAAAAVDRLFRSVFGAQLCYITCVLSIMTIMVSATNKDIVGYDKFMRQ